MSLISKKGLISRIRKGRAARASLVSSHLAEGIAFQIRATCDARDMSLSALAHETGMGQGNLSRLTSPDYGKQSISSLKRIADALDVALVVRFVPFNQYIHWISGTPFLDKGLRPSSIAVPSYEDEEKAGTFAEEKKENVYSMRQIFPSPGGVMSVPAPRPSTKIIVLPPPATELGMSA